MDGILIDLAIVTAVVGTVIFIEFVEDVEAEERADDWAGRGRSPADPILHRTRAAAFRDFNGFRLRPNIHGEFQFCYQRLPWRNLLLHGDLSYIPQEFKDGDDERAATSDQKDQEDTTDVGQS